jgi:hypothetical protein
MKEIKEILNLLSKLNKQIMIDKEGWSMDNPALKMTEEIKQKLNTMELIGHINKYQYITMMEMVNMIWES